MYACAPGLSTTTALMVFFIACPLAAGCSICTLLVCNHKPIYTAIRFPTRAPRLFLARGYLLILPNGIRYLGFEYDLNAKKRALHVSIGVRCCIVLQVRLRSIARLSAA